MERKEKSTESEKLQEELEPLPETKPIKRWDDLGPIELLKHPIE